MQLSWWDSCGRVIGSSHGPLPDNAQYSQQTSMASAGFEPAILVGHRPQTHALDCAATGTSEKNLMTIFEGLTSVFRLKSPGTTSCRLVNSQQCFGENCCPHSGQSKNTALKLEAKNSSEMSVTIHQSTQCCIPEGLLLKCFTPTLEDILRHTADDRKVRQIKHITLMRYK